MHVLDPVIDACHNVGHWTSFLLSCISEATMKTVHSQKNKSDKSAKEHAETPNKEKADKAKKDHAQAPNESKPFNNQSQVYQHVHEIRLFICSVLHPVITVCHKVEYFTCLWTSCITEPVSKTDDSRKSAKGSSKSEHTEAAKTSKHCSES